MLAPVTSRDVASAKHGVGRLDHKFRLDSFFNLHVLQLRGISNKKVVELAAMWWLWRM